MATALGSFPEDSRLARHIGPVHRKTPRTTAALKLSEGIDCLAAWREDSQAATRRQRMHPHSRGRSRRILPDVARHAHAGALPR